MSGKQGKNIAASVRQKLLNLSRSRKEDFNLILSQYAVERLLYRLASSAYRNQFTLKGALLFLIWGGDMHRATRDADLLGSGSPDLPRLREIFTNILAVEVDDDGLRFDPASLRVEQIKPDDEYQGVRIEVKGTIDNARVHVQVDVGFGDVIVPAPTESDLPTMLDQPPPRLFAYPRETVIAEKFQAIVNLGRNNSRMKDFYDLWYLATNHSFDGELLASAIRQTFARRKTPLPGEPPVGLTGAFSSDAMKQTQWSAFVTRGRLTLAPPELAAVIEKLRELLWPIVSELSAGRPFHGTWSTDRGWQGNDAAIT
jgi:hypothetical protein